MKTMRAPKMDVVRFTESDVIVASSPVALQSVTIRGLGNKSFDDNYLDFGSQSVSLSEASAYHVQFGNGFNNNGSIKDLTTLISEASNSGDDSNSDWNHVYNWDESTQYYVYHQ